MREHSLGQATPELKKLVAEASCALARLDKERLEELALSCQSLNRSLGTMSPQQRLQLRRVAQSARADLALFAESWRQRAPI